MPVTLSNHERLEDPERIYLAKPTSAISRFRRNAGGHVVEWFLRGLSTLGRLHPAARPSHHDIEVLRNIPYRETQSLFHCLDVYRPKKRDGLLPALLYIHGGGFRILSKDTHWMMGLTFAKNNYITFNINYRLAPDNPYPAAPEDATAALLWLLKHAESYGADPNRIILAGESAGGNLVTMLTVASHFDGHPEPWAQQLKEAAPQIKAVMPACGLLQVSRPDRFFLRRKMFTLVRDRIIEVSVQYLPEAYNEPGLHPLADPLLFLEEGHTPLRPLPPFFTFAGDKDPILEDTTRLQAALTALDVPCEMRIYPKGGHAFHAMLWKKIARNAWKHQIAFLNKHISNEG